MRDLAFVVLTLLVGVVAYAAGRRDERELLERWDVEREIRRVGRDTARAARAELERRRDECR